jgi:PAS domain S-box-containing protein
MPPLPEKGNGSRDPIDQPSKNSLKFMVGIGLLAALYGVSRYNYLLFHGLSELFSIAVAWAVFMLVWNSKRFIADKALLMLGIAYLFIGLLDMLHMLAYKGMNVFPGLPGADCATQLWIAARYMESISLLLFSLLTNRSVRPLPVFLAYGLATATLLATIFAWPVFPSCYVEGVGLTPFKKVSEYVICLILAGALVLLWRKRHRFDRDVFRFLACAVLLTMAGELSFTFYVSVYGFSNLVGHFFKILSFFLVYMALIRSGLSRPYALLFQDLKSNEEKFRLLVEQAPVSIMGFDASGRVTYVNDYHLQTFAAGRHGSEFFLGRKIHELPGIVKAGIAEQIRMVLGGKPLTMANVHFPEFSGGHSGYQRIKAIPFFKDGNVSGGLLLRENATEEKRMESLLKARLQLSEFAMTHSLEALLRETLDLSEQLTDSRIGFLHFVSEDQTAVDLQMWSTNTMRSHCNVQDFVRHYPVEKAGIWADCLRQRRPVIHNDYASLPRRKGLPTGHAPIVREAVLPIFRSRRIVAILGVGNKPFPYTEQDIAIIRELADMAWDMVIRKRAEDALRESQRKLETLVDNLPGIAFRCTDDPGWTMAYISDGCRPLTGYGPEDFVDNQSIAYADIIHPDDRGWVWEVVQAALDAHEPYEIEYRIVNRDGHTRWVWERGQLIESVGSKRRVLEGFIHDISERKHQETELRQLAAAINQAVEAVVITDGTGNVFYINPAFETITGYLSDDILGRNLKILVKGAQEGDFYENILKEIVSGRTWKGRITCLRKGGTTFMADGSASPVSGEGDVTRGFVFVLRDITEDLKLEERFRQSQKMEAIGSLAGGIAHDFNNILYPMTGYAEILQEDLPPDSPLQNYVAQILKAANRAADLVSQILAFSRSNEQEKKAVRVQSITKEVLKLIKATFPATIRISQDMDLTCPPILADPVQLHQVIMNLLTNALHAMEDEGGTLILLLNRQLLTEEDAETALQPGSYVRLSISDTGKGIEPDLVTRIFEPYFTTKDKGKGTGLGLSVVSGIVQGYGGNIRVESTRGRGTTFTILLPAMMDENETSLPVTAEPIAGGSEHILLVDDDPLILDTAKILLERRGYRVTCRTTGTGALETFKAHPDRYDLVITDMTMPTMTGTALSKKLLEIRRNLPIIICTGFSEKIGAKRAEEIGIRGFLYKPVVKEKLAAEIRRVLDG